MFKPAHLQLFISQIWAWGSSLVSYIWVPLHTISLAEEEMLIFSQNKIAIGQPEVLSSAQLRTGRNSNTRVRSVSSRMCILAFGDIFLKGDFCA